MAQHLPLLVALTRPQPLLLVRKLLIASDDNEK